MSTVRELRDRINSIDNTMKITNAMYLISSTKLRKARQDLQQTEPYFYMLQAMIQRINRHLPKEFKHPYLDRRRDLKASDCRTAIICITADKGLAGAYNHNVLRQTEEMLKKHPQSKLLWWARWDVCIFMPGTFRLRSSSTIRRRIPRCIVPG